MSFGYVKSLPGIMKIIEIVCDFIGLICMATTYRSPKGDAFLGATIVGFLVTVLLLIVFAVDLHEKLKAPWPQIQVVFGLIMAVLLIITSALIIDQRSDTYIAAGIFGLFASVVYVVDAYDKYRHADT